MRKVRPVALCAIALVGCSLLTTVGCTAAEESADVAALETALNSLMQNRSLTEQFVRDVKVSVDPSDPEYLRTMETYQDARDAYNRFLDSAESAPPSGSVKSETPLDVRNATADFLAEATSALRPSVNTRRVPFQRAVVIPENLQKQFAKLPKHARESIIGDLDKQVRWKPWSQL